MKATIPYIEERFRYWNDLIFDGKLPPIEIKLSRAERFLGKVEYRRLYGAFGVLRKCDSFVMRISTAKDLTEDELNDVIIHEMIHYYIGWFGLKDTSAHGQRFRSMMADINERYGRHITISHRRTEQELGEDRRIRQHIVCVSELANGELGVTVCSKTRVFDIMRRLPRYYRIRSTRWFISTDHYFNRFPRSISPKIYKASREQLEDALGRSTELACDGMSLRVKA